MANLNPDRGAGLPDSNLQVLTDLTQLAKALAEYIEVKEQNKAGANELHVLRGTVDQIVNNAPVVRHLNTTIRNRMQNIRTTPLMTVLPTFGHEHDLPKRRDYHINTLGETADPNPTQCQSWLRRMTEISTRFHLSADTFIELMAENSAGRVNAIIHDGILERSTAEEVVREIELHFGGLKTPEQARVECTQVLRTPGESLQKLAERISDLAKMACRLDPDRTVAQDALAKRTFLDGVSPELRLQLVAREESRVGAGNSPWTFRDIQSEAIKMEDQERTALYLAKTKQGSTGASIRQIWDPVQEEKAAYQASVTGSSQAQKSATRASDKGADKETELVQRIAQEVENRLRKRPEQKDKEFRRPEAGPRRYNQKRGDGRNAPFKQRIFQVTGDDGQSDSEYEFGDDEIEAMEEAGIEVVGQCLLIPAGDQMVLRIRPGDLNVKFDECLRCGKTGHRAFGGSNVEKCPLKNLPITTTPCPACRKGGHMAKNCPVSKNWKTDK